MRSRAYRPWTATIIAATVCATAALCPSVAPATEKVTIPATADTPAIPAYLARPTSGVASPAVLILHGCEGYRKRYGKIADGLALDGFVAVAIDTLTPRGVSNACGDSNGSHIEAAYARAALDWMRTQAYVDGQRLALLGYSMGAIASLDIVDPWHAEPSPLGVRAAITYYPACRDRTAANINTPVLILDGDADDWTPATPCRALAEQAGKVNKPVSITTYPGATHAFNVHAPDRTSRGHHLRYDPSASADAHARMLAFLQRYLTSP